MAAIGSKLRSIGGGDGRKRIGYWCPGCQRPHVLPVNDSGSPSWTWDGAVDAPTLAPSILAKIPWSQTVEPGDNSSEWRDEVCHHFLRVGQLEFLADSTHALAGQTVALPDWPSDWSDGDQSDG